MRWWRVFIDKLTGKPSDPGVVGPRRRKHERYEFETKLSAKCSSWPKFAELFTSDVSAGGLYIPSDNLADVGEWVEVALELPNGGMLPLTGTVVNIITAEQAARFGKRQGLGVQLDPPEGEARLKFEQLIAAASSGRPLPEEQTLDGDMPPPPKLPAPVTPTGSVRLSAVQRAIAEDDIDGLAPSRDDSHIDIDVDEDSAVQELPPLPAPKAEPAMPPPHPGQTEKITFKSTEPAPARPRPLASQHDPVVGIDLGTTYTSVAAVVGKKVSMLPWSDGAKSWPSVVSFPDAHNCLVGVDARAKLALDPAHTIASPKRLLGRHYDDREIQGFIGQAPYRTLAGPDGSVVVEIHGQQYAITQLCSYIMQEARRVAEAAVGTEVHRCVMTVPVSFDEERAKVFRRAGEMAQLEVVALIDEPSAAALANRFDPGFGGVVGVYDFGGGTFDFSIVDVSGGDFQVLATAGDTWLGGDDFDQIIAEAAANQFWRMHKVDLRNQAVEWQKLVFACERAKRALSIENEAPIYVPKVLRSVNGMIDLNISIDRATFERACKPVVDRSLATCDEALDLLGMKPTDLTTVYLSGGTTYIPTVRNALAAHFNVPVRTGVPPEHAVCLGAAIHAAQIQYRAATTLDARGD